MKRPNNGNRGKLPDQEIRRLFKRGHSMSQIGERNGTTRQAVQLRLRKMGLGALDGGTYLRTKKRRRVERAIIEKNKRERFQRRAREVYGCSPAYLRRALEDNKYSVQNFRATRRNTTARGVAWNLTLPEWDRLWAKAGIAPRGDSRRLRRMSTQKGYELRNLRIGDSR